jgi:23S rRNA (guanosine2251-2'-O)-methyltransferase
VSRLVLGLQAVREAIRVRGKDLARVVVESGGGPQLDALARFATDQGAPVERVSRADLDRRAGGGRHQGVIALAPELQLTPPGKLLVGPETLLVALDGVMDPQNFGAVLRSAVALGATGVIWPEHASAPLSPATFRASAGAVEHAVLCRVGSLPAVLADLAARGARTVVLDAQAPRALHEVDLTGPLVIVVGSEDKGARRTVRRAGELVRLPMAGPLDSLNASVAAALALYEARRQRTVAALPA